MTKLPITITLIFLTIAITKFALAQDFPTRLATMGNKNPEIADSLNARCASDDDGETLNCTLTTTSIDYVLAPEDKNIRVEQFFEQAELAGSLEAAIDNLFDPNQCESVFQDKVDSSNSPLAKQYRASLVELCAQEPNEENARNLLQLQADIESQTCKVWGSSGGLSLNRAEPDLWRIQTSPEGLCDVYEVFELKCDPSNMYYCDYDEHAVYGKKTGEFCEGFEDIQDEGDHYSSSITMNFEMQCSFIQFTY